MKKILLLLTLLMFLPLFGKSPRCQNCGKRKQRFIRIENKLYCSEKCAPASHKCALCKRFITSAKRYCLGNLPKNNEFYCEPCFNNPKCDSCFRPYRAKKSQTSNEQICPKCKRRQINYDQALKVMQKLRQELAQTYGYEPTHKITLRLVDKETMTKRTGSPLVQGCMLYNRNSTVITKPSPAISIISKRKRVQEVKIQHQCTIYLRNTLTIDDLSHVLVHELTHDYLFHHIGEPTDPLVNEGICEAVSGAWLLKHGFKQQFEAKKENPLTEYGGGFRKMYPQLKRYGFKMMLEKNKHHFKPFSD